MHEVFYLDVSIQPTSNAICYIGVSITTQYLVVGVVESLCVSLYALVYELCYLFYAYRVLGVSLFRHSLSTFGYA